MKAFTDRSPMPFGQYSAGNGDERSLEEVPASYLMWIWETGQLWNQQKLQKSFEFAHHKRDQILINQAEEWIALHNYIAANFTKLEIIATDVTVRHRPKLKV